MINIKRIDVYKRQAFPNTFEAKVLVEPEMKWRLIEEFGR